MSKWSKKMMNKRIYTFLFVLIWSSLGTFAFAQETTQPYTAHDDVIANPERGFYRYIDSLSSEQKEWTAADLQADVAWSNVIEEEEMTLVYCLFYLDQYMNTDTIPAAFINHINSNLQAVQDSGRKCILRFAYTSDLTYTAGLSDGRNDADYGNPDNGIPDILETGNNDTEPNVDRIVEHINQLGAEVITPKRDAIATLHAGFIGLWGEWYYTSNFADNSAALWEITEANYADRCQVVAALLNGIPADMQVAVRMVVHKQGIAAAACTNLDLSRVSFHNDAFLSAWGDSGTFLAGSEYPENNPTADYTASRAYLAQETLTVAMGGEINEAYNSDPDAVNSPHDRSCDRALEEFAEFHWTYINVLYHKPALERWEEQGCLDEIQNQLGYRFNMVQGTFPNSANIGDTFSFQLEIDNVGFAAPISDYAVELVLLDSNGEEAIYWNLNENIKSWYGGTTTILNKTVSNPVPSWLSPGDYDLYLRLLPPRPANDDEANLNSRIQMANVGTWNALLGMNSLEHAITIGSGGTNPTATPTSTPIIPTATPTSAPVVTATPTPPPSGGSADPLAIKATKLTTYNNRGSIGDGQTVSNLHNLDQTGGDDDWNKYVEFLSTETRYIGYRSYYLPTDIDRDNLGSIQVDFNYRGPDKSTQRWVWYFYDWANSKWVYVGDNGNGTGWSDWETFTFIPKGEPANYVNPTTREIRVRHQAQNTADNMQLDYETVVVREAGSTQLLSPYRMDTHANSVWGGTTGDGQVVENLHEQDQSGAADDWDQYVEFISDTARYSGYRRYNLPVGVDKNDIVSLKLHLNYRGPSTSTQVWSWQLYKWKTDTDPARWVTLGNNAGVPAWEWTPITFNAYRTLGVYTFADFVHPTNDRLMFVRVVSNNTADNMNLDYEAIEFGIAD